LSNELVSTLSRTEVSKKILEVLYHFRRVNPSSASGSGAQDDGSCVACFQARQSKIENFVLHDEPIMFVIPAFPAKSPNREKVLGALPDLGERIALGFLQSLCDYISHFYAPGARIMICSDGHVFADVVRVSDEAVTGYRESLAAIIATEGWNSLELFGLDDAFDNLDYPMLRSVLERDYAVSLEELRANVQADEAARSLFNGIHRFMFEDAQGLLGGQVSRTKLRNDSKAAAYQTIRRSNAWSRLVAERFPDAMRLSIHPQPPHSGKFGLHLMRTADRWLTPWHGVVLDDGVTRTLVKRWEAEKFQATLVCRDGRPSHFVAPHIGINS
jgi:L-tyrosine isonitrile synthase